MSAPPRHKAIHKLILLNSWNICHHCQHIFMHHAFWTVYFCYWIFWKLHFTHGKTIKFGTSITATNKHIHILAKNLYNNNYTSNYEIIKHWKLDLLWQKHWHRSIISWHSHPNNLSLEWSYMWWNIYKHLGIHPCILEWRTNKKTSSWRKKNKHKNCFNVCGNVFVPLWCNWWQGRNM